MRLTRLLPVCSACSDLVLLSLVALGSAFSLAGESAEAIGHGAPPIEHRKETGLVGHWRLQGDCRDYSGKGNHGVNHGVELQTGRFNGISAHIEVPSTDSLRFGTGEFTLCAWIYTETNLDDVVGDVLDMYDPAHRRGVTLCVCSSG